MLKLKHLRHPLRAAGTAKHRMAAHAAARRFADRSRRAFRDDPRYDLRAVSKGFASRIDHSRIDEGVLDRICTAYIKSIEKQDRATPIYQATEWWAELQRSSLTAVRRALQARDIRALGKMYRNFFRDPCSTGLINVPFGVPKAYFGNTIRDAYLHAYLGDTLHRIDYWKDQTSDRFALSELAGPDAGNPFGAVLDGTLVRTGAPYQHYCARRVIDELDAESNVVAEIGGGFGGMAYYLLRDRPGVKYLGFDVPESIALTSYYLLTSFPELKFVLYGEGELTPEQISRSDVALMPLFEMEKIAADSAGVVFSSHAMSDLSREAMSAYLGTIVRITRKGFVYVGNGSGARLIAELANGDLSALKMVELKFSKWNSHCNSAVSEIDCLYRFSGGRGEPTQQTAQVLGSLC